MTDLTQNEFDILQGIRDGALAYQLGGVFGVQMYAGMICPWLKILEGKGLLYRALIMLDMAGKRLPADEFRLTDAGKAALTPAPSPEGEGK